MQGSAKIELGQRLGGAAGLSLPTAEKTLPASALAPGPVTRDAADEPTAAINPPPGLDGGSRETPKPTHAASLPDAASQRLDVSFATQSEARADAFAPPPGLAEQSAPNGSSRSWSPRVNAASEEPIPAPETRVVPLKDYSEAIAPSEATGVRLAVTDDSPNNDLDLANARKPRPRRVVSLVVASVVAVLFGASGFASGYLLGAAKRTPPMEQARSALPVVVAGAAKTEAQHLPIAPKSLTPEAVTSALSAGNATAPMPPNTEDSKSKKASERRADDMAPGRQPQAAPVSAAQPGVDPLSGLSLATGPGPVAGTGGPSAGAGTGLEASAIQSTVQKNQNAVKRSCWQPALNNRSVDAPSTARVTTTIHISPSGAVTHVKHSGDPRGYPGLGACIVNRLKSWTFPKSNGSTTANIPFVFAAQ